MPATPRATSRPSAGATVALALAACLLAATPGAVADEAVWALLREGGHVALIRHAATVPGFGDPPGFRHEDCATQRLLSDEGRAQARRLGEAFRARGVPVGEVLSSRWCRCEETARLAFGRSQPWTALDSMHYDRSRAAEQERDLRAGLARRPRRATLVLVTHAANISAWTGTSPRQGEVVVVAPERQGRLRVVGRLTVD